MIFPLFLQTKEGLSPLGVFRHHARFKKGLADTALNTARAGYLTRRLVYVADNAIIMEEDCGTKEGRAIARKNVSGFDVSLARNIKGRIIAEDIASPDGEVLYKKEHCFPERTHNVLKMRIFLRWLFVRRFPCRP